MINWLPYVPLSAIINVVYYTFSLLVQLLIFTRTFLLLTLKLIPPFCWISARRGGIQGSPLGVDFAPWGAKSDARYPCGQGDTLCPRSGKAGWAGIRWPTAFLLGTLGRYGIKSNAIAILEVSSGITFNAAVKMTANDVKNDVMPVDGLRGGVK